MFTKVSTIENRNWITVVSTSFDWPYYSDLYLSWSLYPSILLGAGAPEPSQLFSPAEGFRTLLVREDFFSTYALTDTIAEISEHDIGHFIGHALSEVPEVEYVLTNVEGKFFIVWTVIDKVDWRVMDSIYDIELAIMDKFPDMEFDFHLICRQGRDPKALLPSEGKLAFSRDA